MTRTLGELLSEAALTPEAGATQVCALAHDSRRVVPGTLFFCVSGAQSDGHDFARVAVEAGAVALVVERLVEGVQVPQVLLADSRRALAQAAAGFFDHPSEQLRVTGITGTNGKTTTTSILESLLQGCGRTTGLIGTVETHIAGRRMAAERTTPDALELQQLLAQMRDVGVSDVVMEVSSHALDLERTFATRFAVAAFTNLSQDHLDWHHDMERYFAAKKKLFFEHEVAARVINVDDPWGRRLFDELRRSGLEAFAVGASDSDVDLGLSWDPASVRFAPDRTRFTLGEAASPVEAPLVGAYNIHNVLVALGCALQLGLSLEELAPLLATIAPVPGRLEPVDAGQDFRVLVDYAHTDDALRTALGALREVTPGRLITVFGCGGDRDRSKRPLMGRAAGQCSDYVIATSDNPRSEDPAAILAQIEPGLKETQVAFEIIVDRATAIRRAIEVARAGDCVLIAGKGHEDYQIFADETIHFDDREVAQRALEERGSA
ncbi:MAG: UDP-N-acetylmuramoyl-L-alanyl-D-glutamate--2,6-diaminopimelate ligase [Actinomycetia bacterium]|nr:UDP-N-acetylmuramoyl-L-alanyl-D-glutamate--2,6-diaminopimelate ligase [Actinomycetes bacterium]